MSHAGLAIVFIGFAVSIGLARGRVDSRSPLAVGVALACTAVAFHVVELLFS
jgi:hypothetical protein